MGERGQGVIELALALPVFLAVIGAVIDGGWAFHQAGMVSVAAQAAQRAVGIIDTGAGHCAGAPPSVYTDLALSAARVAAPTLDPGRMALGLQYLEPGCSGRMRTLAVSVGYPIKALTPWFAPLLSGLRLTARAATAVEELAPPWWGQAGEVQVLGAHGRGAGGGGDHHRLGVAEHVHEAPHEGQGLALVAGVVVHLAAAGLRLGELDPVPEPLQHGDGRLSGFGEERVVEAGDEERHAHGTLQANPCASMDLGASR